MGHNLPKHTKVADACNAVEPSRAHACSEDKQRYYTSQLLWQPPELQEDLRQPTSMHLPWGRRHSLAPCTWLGKHMQWAYVRAQWDQGNCFKMYRRWHAEKAMTKKAMPLSQEAIEGQGVRLKTTTQQTVLQSSVILSTRDRHPLRGIQL
jgi:hypothetical protein